MANIFVIDFETYWDVGYTLSSMTTESYLRDPRFKVHGVGIQCLKEKNGVLIPEKPMWITGKDVARVFQLLHLENERVIMHHAHFDGAILNWHYGIKPKFFFDTLSMARGLHGPGKSASLASLVQMYGIGEKGQAVYETKGVRDLPPDMERRLADYCANGDVVHTGLLFAKMLPQYPASELKLIDKVVRMFTEPKLLVDASMAQKELDAVREEKERLLNLSTSAFTKAAMIDPAVRDALGEGTIKDVLMSNNKLAILLQGMGVPVPMKVSKATGKDAFAFAKSDKDFTALLEHDNLDVQAVVAARLGVKSTIMETRLQSFINISGRGAMPVYYKYGATQTHRLAGGDGSNMTNLTRGSSLRRIITAPDGYEIVSGDSSNIELRVNMMLAGQSDVIELLRNGGDPYCDLAATIYGRPITKADKTERQLGKTAELGLGFGLGDPLKFQNTARLAKPVPVFVSIEEAQSIIAVYRKKRYMIPRYWRTANDAIRSIASGNVRTIDTMGLIKTGPYKIHFPTGLPLCYPELHEGDDGWEYASGRGKNKFAKIYGAKCVENCTQGIARNVVMEQTLVIAKEMPVVMSTYDEAVVLVRTDEVKDAIERVQEIMSVAPKWFPGIPIAAEVGHGRNYADAH